MSSKHIVAKLNGSQLLCNYLLRLRTERMPVLRFWLLDLGLRSLILAFFSLALVLEDFLDDEDLDLLPRLVVRVTVFSSPSAASPSATSPPSSPSSSSPSASARAFSSASARAWSTSRGGTQRSWLKLRKRCSMLSWVYSLSKSLTEYSDSKPPYPQ